MKQEEFNELLKKSGLPKEFSLKIDQLVRVANAQEEQIRSLTAQVSVLQSRLKETNETVKGCFKR